VDSPETVWAILYLVVAVAFGAGEMTMPGSFFLLPFSVGGIAAALVSVLGLGLAFSFPVFVLVSFLVFLGFRPLARKLEAETPELAGVGSNRLLGTIGQVLQAIPADAGVSGMVKVSSEVWRADADNGVTIPAGSQIRVIQVTGTRLIVEPVDNVDIPELG